MTPRARIILAVAIVFVLCLIVIGGVITYKMRIEKQPEDKPIEYDPVKQPTDTTPIPQPPPVTPVGCGGKTCNGGTMTADCKCQCETNRVKYTKDTCCPAEPACKGLFRPSDCSCTCYMDCGENGTRQPDCSCLCKNGYSGTDCKIPPPEQGGVNLDSLYAEVRAGRTVTLRLWDGTSREYNKSMGVIHVWLLSGQQFYYDPNVPPPPPPQPPPTGSNCPVINCGPGRLDAASCKCVCPAGFSGANCRVSDKDYNACVSDKTGTLRWTGYKCVTNAGGCPTTRKQVCSEYRGFNYMHDPTHPNPFECTSGDSYGDISIGDSVDYSSDIPGRCFTAQSSAGCQSNLQWLGCE